MGSSKHKEIFIFYFPEPKTQRVQTQVRIKIQGRYYRLGLKTAGEGAMGVTPNPFLSSPAPVLSQGELNPQHLPSTMIQLYKGPYHFVLNHCRSHGSENISPPNNCLSLIDIAHNGATACLNQNLSYMLLGF